MPKKKNSLQPYLKTLTLLCIDSSILTNSIYYDIFNILFKDVITVSSPKEASRVFSSKSIDLIITEYSFENENIFDMIDSLRESNPNIPIILASEFENVDMLTQALHHKIHNFVKKPFDASDLLDAVENATKLLLADAFIEEKRQKELTLLQEKIEYTEYQEMLSLQKEIKIARNDYYYKYVSLLDRSSFILIDFMYKAKDTLSGDLYSVRKVKNKTFLFLVDGMGKGISAALSAIVSIAFINRILDRAVEEGDDIDLEFLISKMLKSIQNVLFDEEILSGTFIMLDAKNHLLEYASFAMPPLLIMNDKDEVISLKSNNIPITSYSEDFKIDKIQTKEIRKLLLYSDGLVENSVKNENATYAEYIQKDFKNSITREDFRKRVMSKITEQEDDITFIFLNEICLDEELGSLHVKTNLEEVEKAGEWFIELISKSCTQEDKIQSASLAFNELMINAYEHGNLGLKCCDKHKLIEDDKYFECLAQKESTCKKKIKASVYTISNLIGENYIVVSIEDEGAGFDTSILSDIFGVNKQQFNSRGILMSRNSSLGIYYNDKANKVTFISSL